MSVPPLDDLQQVERLARLYIEGAAGDAAKLREAFHPQAQMFGKVGTREVAVPIEQFFATVQQRAGTLCGPRYRATVIRVDVVGDAGVVAIAEEDYLGSDYVDWFSVARLDGRWQIVNKTFHGEKSKATAA